jgi:hypothetical protein
MRISRLWAAATDNKPQSSLRGEHHTPGHSPRPVVAPGPVVFLQIVNPHRLTGSGCVDKQMIAQIDTDVREGVAQGIEKHQVPRLKFILGHRRTGLADFAGNARQYQAHALTENVADKAGAIKTGLRPQAAATIAHADQLYRAIDDLLHTVAIAYGSGPGFRRWCRQLGGDSTSSK